MVANLILVEGIPGAGKSTTARKIEQRLRAQGAKVRCFQEGELHPCDLAWHACVPASVYRDLFSTFEEHRDALEHYTPRQGATAYVAYTKLELGPDHPLFTALKRYEPYRGSVSLNEFKALHLSRWCTFAERVKGDEVTYIFECAYFQNHVTELMLTYQEPAESIAAYMQALIETARPLKPHLIYLSPTDIAWVIDHAANERKSEHPGWKDWFDQVIDYIKDSDYGKANRTTGRTGVLEFFERRRRLELDIIEQLPTECHVYEVDIGFTQSPIEDARFASALFTS